ncbi:MAG: alpha/beta fold hydrolase [Mycobacteriales bacterium]
MFIDVNGKRLRVMDFGTGDRVLVTHGGWTGNWELWSQQAEALTRQGWRVVAYDHRGSGQSPTPGEAITPQTLVRDLFAVLDHLNIRGCVLAGESMGTAVVLLAALEQPERFKGLVLVAGAPVWRRLSLSPFLWGLRLAYYVTVRVFITLAVPERDVRGHMRRWARALVGQARPCDARALVAGLIGTDLRARLADLTLPALVVHGAKDRIVPARDGKALAAALSNSELLMLPGAGHVPTMTRPHEVSAAIARKFA